MVENDLFFYSYFSIRFFYLYSDTGLEAFNSAGLLFELLST